MAESDDDVNLDEYFDEESLFRTSNVADKELNASVKNKHAENDDNMKFDGNFDENYLFRTMNVSGKLFGQSSSVNMAKGDDDVNLDEYFDDEDSVFRTSNVTDKVLNASVKYKPAESDDNVNLDAYFDKRSIFRTSNVSYKALGQSKSNNMNESDNLNMDEYFDKTSIFRTSNAHSDEEFVAHSVLPRDKTADETTANFKKSKDRKGISTFADFSGFGSKEKRFFSKSGNKVGTFLDRITRRSKENEFNEEEESGFKEPNRKAKLWPLFADRESTNRTKSKQPESSFLDKRGSRSTEALEDKSSKPGLINFVTKFNQVLSPILKAKSTDNLDDLENKGASKKVWRHNRESALKRKSPWFPPQKLELQSEFDTIGPHGERIGGMAATDDDSCWLFFRGGSATVRITDEGVKMKHIKIQQAIDDLTMDDEYNMYLMCPRSKEIIFMDTHGRGATFVNLRGFPRCIAYNSSKNEIVVCLNDSSPMACSDEKIKSNSIIRYSVKRRRRKEEWDNGIEKRVDSKLVSYDNCTSLPNLSCPVRVCVNSQTADYVFTDFLRRSIVIYDCNLKFRHIIVGNDIFELKNCLRHPVVCCDFQRRLFAFSNNPGTAESPNCVVLDENGKILEKIYERKADSIIHSANFDSSGRLWMASGNTVLVYQVNI